MIGRGDLVRTQSQIATTDRGMRLAMDAARYMQETRTGRRGAGLGDPSLPQ